MKKVLFLLGGLLSSLAINAQVLSNSDVAILFSGEENNGTARYNAMGGAFGALGGDLSAGDINPAGLAIFKNSSFSTSLSLRNTDINAGFSGTNTLNENDYLNLTQGGGVLVFNGGRHSDTQKIAIGFNYSISRDFENNWFTTGNSGFAPITDFYDPDVIYGNTEEQTFENFTNGRNDKFVFSFAAQSSENLYVGASITTHSIDFYQSIFAEEFNNDGEGNTFDVSAHEELSTFGTGVSFGVGFIAKPSKELRLGVSFQSPTRYELSEEYVAFDDVLFFNGEPDIQRDIESINVFDYNLVTPAKLTGSLAYIVGKEGLISFDYTYKDFKNIKLKPSGEFNDENQNFSNTLKGVSQFKVGAEWRIDKISLRGGYHFEESPYADAIDSDNISGYSLGVGLKFTGNTRLDFSYQNSKNTDVYNFLNVDGAQPANLDIDNDRFTATLVIGL
jgi:long-subunit fatty acid transport protein